MRRRDNTTRPGGEAATVAEAVERQATEAAALAGIAGQDRLLDPATNPAVRPHFDRLRDAGQVTALDARHARRKRQYRVADKRAAHAEKTLDVLQAAEDMSSPARSVLALHKGRRKFLGISLVASLSLSVGSAIGVAHLADKHNANPLVGYLSEIGLTGLTTMAILYRSHLGEHGDADQLKKPDGKMTWQAMALWALIILPLTAGIVANSFSYGISVFCSIGAAAFSLFSYVISDQSGAALQHRAAKVNEEDKAELHRLAMGDDPYASVRQVEQPAEDTPVIEDREAEASDLFTTEQLAQWLHEPPEDEDGRPDETPPGDDDPEGAAKALPRGQVPPVAGSGDTGTGRSHHGETTGETTGSHHGETPGSHHGETRSHFRTKPEMRPGLTSGASRKTAPGSAGRSQVSAPAAPSELGNAANLARGDETAKRVHAYETAHPGATVAQVCAALAVSKATVMRARKKNKNQEV